MQFTKATHVYNADYEDIGRVDRVIINPLTKEVTHVVIPRGLLVNEDKVILIDYFQKATDRWALLSADIDDLNDLPRFDEFEYVTIDDEEIEAFMDAVEQQPFYLYWNPAAEDGNPLTYNWLLWYDTSVQ